MKDRITPIETKNVMGLSNDEFHSVFSAVANIFETKRKTQNLALVQHTTIVDELTSNIHFEPFEVDLTKLTNPSKSPEIETETETENIDKAVALNLITTTTWKDLMKRSFELGRKNSKALVKPVFNVPKTTLVRSIENIRFDDKPLEYIFNLFRVDKKKADYTTERYLTTSEELDAFRFSLKNLILSLINQMVVGTSTPSVTCSSKLGVLLVDCTDFKSLESGVTQFSGAGTLIGTLSGVNIVIDPYMSWSNNEICISLHGVGTQGLSIVHRGKPTNKNYGISVVEIGDNPEMSYYTIEIDVKDYYI